MHTAEGQQRQKKQEAHIAKVLKENGIHFQREHRVDFTCAALDTDRKCARIDFVILAHGHVVCLEVDEGEHRFGYTVLCDMARMSHIHESMAIGGNTLPVVFLRYNPQQYTVNGKLQRKPRKYREERLIQLLQDPSSDVGSGSSLAIKYMYYDAKTTKEGGSATTRLEIHDDPDYNAVMRSCCLQSVI